MVLVLIYAYYLNLEVKEEGIKKKKKFFFFYILSHHLASNEPEAMMVRIQKLTWKHLLRQ